MDQVFLFAGTKEGQRLARSLGAAGIKTAVSVAAEYGTVTLEETGLGDEVRVLHDRMDSEAMEDAIRAAAPKVVVDATHPYALEVSERIRLASEHAGVPYLLCHDSSDVFAGKLAQIVYDNGVAKWQIYIGNVNYTADGMFTYTIYMVDNYRDPDTLILTYNAGFWIPQDKYGNGKTYTITPGPTNTVNCDGVIVTFNEGFTLNIATT